MLMPADTPHILRFDPARGDHAAAFKALNMRWLQQYFVVEPVDEQVLTDPKTHILDGGGEIWMAELGGKPVGCVALKLVGGDVFELTKLAVAPKAQGLGLGRKLMQQAQDRFLSRNAKKLFLDSNDQLQTARQMYQKLGWQDATPPTPSHYARANVHMVWQPQLSDIQITMPESTDDIAAVKQLFQEYAQQLGVDLCFQGFTEEMASFPAKYDLLLLAKQGGSPVGAVGLWTLADGVCEMKRLYVLPGLRGQMLGRRLSLILIEQARRLGFKTMKLDTLARLTPAVKLYRDLGFTETHPYNHNPESDILYFEMDVTKRDKTY